GYVLVCADETARRRAERQFSTVVAALDEGVLVIGPDGRVVSANPAAEHILGISESDMLSAPPDTWPLYDQDGRRLDPSEYPSSQLLRGGEPQKGRVMRAKRADGRIVWLAVSCRAMNPEDMPSSAFVVSFTDITERKAIGERLAH